jgi:hypothetical protein
MQLLSLVKTRCISYPLTYRECIYLANNLLVDRTLINVTWMCTNSSTSSASCRVVICCTVCLILFLWDWSFVRWWLKRMLRSGLWCHSLVSEEPSTRIFRVEQYTMWGNSNIESGGNYLVLQVIWETVGLRGCETRMQPEFVIQDEGRGGSADTDYI